jgi:hypothetical protein
VDIEKRRAGHCFSPKIYLVYLRYYTIKSAAFFIFGISVCSYRQTWTTAHWFLTQFTQHFRVVSSWYLKSMESSDQFPSRQFLDLWLSRKLVILGDLEKIGYRGYKGYYGGILVNRGGIPPYLKVQWNINWYISNGLWKKSSVVRELRTYHCPWLRLVVSSDGSSIILPTIHTPHYIIHSGHHLRLILRMMAGHCSFDR